MLFSVKKKKLNKTNLYRDVFKQIREKDYWVLIVL